MVLVINKNYGKNIIIGGLIIANLYLLYINKKQFDCFSLSPEKLKEKKEFKKSLAKGFINMFF